jgi:hypothetical protein
MTQRSGWACSYNGTPFRFEQPGELDDHQVWLTNVTAARLRSSLPFAHFKSSNFLRIPLAQLLEDMGLESESAARQVEILCALAHNVHQATDRLYDNTPAANADWSQHDSLSSVIVSALPSTKPAARNQLAVRMAAAYQGSSVNPTFIPAASGRIITVRGNRIQHALRVLSTRIPSGAFQPITCRNYRSLRLLAETHPVLVRAEVREHCALSAVGMEIHRQRKRSWFSMSELEWLHNIADVQILEAQIGEGYDQVSGLSQFTTLLKQEPLFEMSLAIGIVADNHLHTVFGDAPQDVASPPAVWLRASDRAMSFQMARCFDVAGVPVVSYANGSVRLFVERDRKPMVDQLRERLELCFPLSTDGRISHIFSLMDAAGLVQLDACLLTENNAFSRMKAFTSHLIGEAHRIPILRQTLLSNNTLNNLKDECAKRARLAA